MAKQMIKQPENPEDMPGITRDDAPNRGARLLAPGAVDPPAPGGAAAGARSRGPGFRRLLPYLLVVPAAQTRLLDLEYQAALYEVFHRRSINRISHYVCIPVITWALLALLALIPTPVGLPVYTVLAAVTLLAWYATAARRLFALALVCLAALTTSVYLVVDVYALLDVQALVLVLLGASYCLTITHALEEVPPPWSGRRQWTSVGEAYRNAGPWKLGLMVFCALTIYVVVELISAPRLFAVQLEHLHRLLAGLPRCSATRSERVRRVLAGDVPLFQP